MAAPEIEEPKAGDKVVEVAGFEHRYAEVNGTRIHYVLGGTGPAVVLMHGWPYTWREFEQVLGPLAAQGFTVIAPDLRGTGASALEEEGFDNANVAKDVHQLVAAEGFDRAGLLGTDVGMMIAFAYALDHPEAVRGLVLAEAILPGFGLEELMNPAKGGYWHFGFHMQVDVATMLTAGREEAYLLPTMERMSVAPDAQARARNIYIPQYARPGRMKAGFQLFAHIVEDGKANQQKLTSKFPFPVMALNGEKGIPAFQTVDSVKKVAENVTVLQVPGAGHVYGEDNPVWVAQRLGEFFRNAL